MGRQLWLIASVLATMGVNFVFELLWFGFKLIPTLGAVYSSYILKMS